MKYFALHGANFNAETLSDTNCLQLAVMSGNFELVKFLVSNLKVNPQQENLSGQTALSLASDFKDSAKDLASSAQMLEYLKLTSSDEGKDKKTRKSTGKSTNSSKSTDDILKGRKDNIGSEAGSERNFYDYEMHTKKAIRKVLQSKYIKTYPTSDNISSFELAAEELFGCINKHLCQTNQ